MIGGRGGGGEVRRDRSGVEVERGGKVWKKREKEERGKDEVRKRNGEVREEKIREGKSKGEEKWEGDEKGDEKKVGERREKGKKVCKSVWEN